MNDLIYTLNKGHVSKEIKGFTYLLEGLFANWFTKNSNEYRCKKLSDYKILSKKTLLIGCEIWKRFSYLLPWAEWS